MIDALKKLKNIYGSSVSAERVGNGVIIYFKGYPIDVFHIGEFYRNKLRFQHWLKTINAIYRVGIEHTHIDKTRWSDFHKTRKRGTKLI